MFCVGTPVIVVRSDYKRKASPRVGSLGFIVHKSMHVHVRKERDFASDYLGINFFKYGYEKKLRSEYLVVPTIYPSYRVLERGMNYSEEQLLNYVDKKVVRGAGKLLVAPINEPITLNHVEIFFAYLNALSKNGRIIDFTMHIHDIQRRGKRSKLWYGKFLESLDTRARNNVLLLAEILCAYKRKGRTKFLHDWFIHQEGVCVTNLIEATQIVKNTAVLHGKRGTPVAKPSSMVAKYLFDDLELKRMLNARTIFKKEVLNHYKEALMKEAREKYKLHEANR